MVADTQEGKSNQPIAKILVALDASPHSAAALSAAAQLAVALDADLEGVFVEDIDLVHLCCSPLAYEVSSLTAAVRRLDMHSMERQLRCLANHIHRNMQRTLSPELRWTFRVLRGSVAEELLTAARDVSFVSLGRSSGRRRHSLGSTTQKIVQASTRPLLILDQDGRLKSPYTVIFTGSSASERALDLAAQLAARSDSVVQVVFWPQRQTKTNNIDTMRRQVSSRATSYSGDVDIVQREIHYDFERHAILTSGQQGTVLFPRELAALASERKGPVILVP